MLKIYKSTSRNIKYKGNIAELYICNFNGKITYKYIDKIDLNVRSASHSDITTAVKDMKSVYKQREIN